MKPVCIFLVLSSAVMACNRENPVPPGSGDSVELLRSLDTARGFERAQALEQLGLTTDAIAAWDAVVRERSQGWKEARKRRDALVQRPDPMEEWRKLHATPQQLARAYPFESTRELLDRGLSDPATARIVADVLAQNGDHYLQDVLKAMERPGNGDAMRAYRYARSSEAIPDYERAAVLLERAGNPLHLYARYRIARNQFHDKDVVPLLDTLIPSTDRRYRLLSWALHTLRAGALEQRGSYLLAYPEYEEALRLAQSATQRAAIWSRRSLNYKTVGSVEKAFRDSIDVLHLLPRVPDLNTHSTAYGSAAEAASELGYPKIALLYRNAIVEVAQKVLLKAPVDQRGEPQHVLAVAFRERANTHAALKNIAAANIDLRRARDLAEALNDASLRQPLRMRLLEVQGETLLATDPAAAAQAFRDAIKQAEGQHSTYRAVLHFKLAEALRRRGDTSADKDVVIAFDILREEAKHLLDARKRGEYEEYWSTYFSRFREVHRAAIQRTFDLGDPQDAFVQDERVRAYEPLYALLQGRSTPPGFHTIVTRDDLRRQLALLPEDTIILQYLVLPDQTYVWVLTHGAIKPVRLPVTETQIEKWGEGVVAALRTGRRDLFTIAMRALYAGLFRTPLAGSQRAKRVVIVPDGPMYGLPFAALEGTKEEGYLLESVKSIATDASTSRYLYSLARDRQFATDGRPSVLLTAATEFDQRSGEEPLKEALPEVNELRRWYPQAEVLSGAEATVPRFLAAARGATIVHFAGHALPVPRRPWESQLLLASGELTAEKLMRQLSELERTRLVVLGACSTAGGQPVGPEGLAPLVRPLIAANVPAVVGTLWDVKDATAKELLVSLHCHYRRGDDVAVALRAAQLERLQNDDPAMMWAPYQVVGYAGSPYAAPPEKTPNESVCVQNSLQRPDGLHPE